MSKKRWANLFVLIATCASLAVLVTHTAQKKAYALPLFARRLGVSCATCHTSPPRLNETGYKFRAAGYRMPEEIGKGGENKPFKLTDYSGVRLQARFDATRFRTGQDDDDRVHFNLFAAEFYTLYGPWGGNLSSNLKATIYPEESVDTENHLRVEGNLKLTLGNDKRFFEIRGGVPHPMEGFGASDVAITNTRPYFQETPANFDQSTFFTPWNFHQAAVTVGYYQGRNSVRAMLLEGIRLHTDGQPFGRKEPFTEDAPLSKHPKPDFQLMANRILHDNAGSVTLYYYHGNVTLPILDTKGGAFQNFFDRVALYGSYPVKKVTLFGGVQRGRDDRVTGGRFTSLGAYGEATVPVFNDLTHAGVRYDWFDPARGKSDNELRGLTAYINAWYRDQFRFVVEYQRRNQQRGLLADKNDNAFQVRLIYVK
ncbi:MAG: hypothetical protein AB1631_10770 [Acidobacteriota bacterium]